MLWPQKQQENLDLSSLGVFSPSANVPFKICACVCVCVFMPVPVYGWDRKDYINKGGSANQEFGHVWPGHDSHIMLLQCNT